MTNEIPLMVCFCCRNHNCESYTIYDGFLMCEYCLDEWLKDQSYSFEDWCIEHKKELDKELEEAKK